MNDYDMPLILYAARLETPLGLMLSIGYEKALCYLTFVIEQEIEPEINQFARKTKATIQMNKVESIISIEKELGAYFQGKLIVFKTPCHALGTPFQQRAWDALRQIPFAQIRSYKEQAVAIGNPSACRAVAGANSANPISIVIPCHRIINSNGNLGGYAGGIDKKQWLLEHEKKYNKRRYF
jgi:AraC family transcriptional regulator of adaptative response/methylated-DNA-[protein]-cysteine methyltransferase